MPNRDIVVIGASAGGVEALTRLVKDLPAELPATIFIAIHFPSYGISVLPQILNRCRSLPALHPKDKQKIELGQIYIAPPDYHLLVKRDRIRLDRGPKENGHRPAIDVLFRSAARSYGRRVIGIILSGMLDDGAVGLSAIKELGGLAIVQDPEEALFNSMPRRAIETTAVDRILKLTDMASALTGMVGELVEEGKTMPDEIQMEADIVAQEKAASEQGERPNKAAPLTCPDCGGVLWELPHSNLIRFRCHVGHVYSSDSLLSEQTDAVEKALWSAVRALEEKAALARRMAVQAREKNRLISEAQFREQAQIAKYNADLVRQALDRQAAMKLKNELETSDDDLPDAI